MMFDEKETSDEAEDIYILHRLQDSAKVLCMLGILRGPCIEIEWLVSIWIPFQWNDFSVVPLSFVLPQYYTIMSIYVS